ncbi:MAG: pitrilysin family protein [Candidatus Pacearchaeota archaeon]|nr:pitrilysin family protein [Candidatus Pacearchaeota archaeon]
MNDFYKKRLSNGLTVLFEKRKLPIVAIVVLTKTGAAYEVKQTKGLAHFFEHMLFKGSFKRDQKQISSAIERVGGILNGFTSEEMTAFWCKLPSKHFERGFDVITDMVANPKLDAKELERERGVILQEMNMIHDQPKQFLFDKMKEISYKTPFAWSILGFKENIKSFTRKNFSDWHNNFYCPDNLVVSVVGNVEFSDIISLCETAFKQIGRTQMPKITISTRNSNFIEKREHIDQAHLGFLFHLPKLGDEKRYACDVMNAVLGEGMSSRLFQEVREKRGLAYTVKSFVEQERDYGHCMVYAGVEKPNLKKVKEIILKEIKGMRKIDKKEFEDAKEQCIGRNAVESEQCENVAIQLFLQESVTKAEEIYKYADKISEVKLKDVLDLVKFKGLSQGMIVPV